MSKREAISPSFTDDDLNSLRKPKPFILSKFLYNAEDGTVMGRDRASWGKSIAVWLSFYFRFFF